MTTLVYDPAYAGWVFDTAHPTQGRRYPNAAALISALPGVQVVAPRTATRDELLRVHTLDYITQVLDSHTCDEWSGARPDLAELASLFAGGTLTALELLMSGNTALAVNLAGGKHHAMAHRSSGFCVFADLAIAADIAGQAGHRVAVFDIDAHHGDGTEVLCAPMPHVLTFSVHQFGIFPGTGSADAPEVHAYNEPLAAGAGDVHLQGATERFLALASDFNPTLLFVAAGADGHRDDPLASLHYTEAGFHSVGALLRRHLGHLPVLVTGAGGYRPDDATPASWAAFVAGISGH